jgi:hypothetical protein
MQKRASAAGRRLCIYVSAVALSLVSIKGARHAQTEHRGNAGPRLWRRLCVSVFAVALLVFALSGPEHGAAKVCEYYGAKFNSPVRDGPYKGTPSVLEKSL